MNCQSYSKDGKSYEWIPVTKRFDGSSIAIPLITIRGKGEGPSLLVVGGVHGDEPEGMIPVLKLVEQIEPAKLKGTFLGIPALNVPALQARKRGNPLDDWSYDMNRLFPGSAKGSVTQRIAATLCEQIAPRADMVVAFHSGGNNICCCERIIIPEFTPPLLELARAMGPAWNIIATGAGERKGIADLSSVLARGGRRAMTLEIGGVSERLPGSFRKNLDAVVSGILNLMRHYKMIDGSPVYAPECKLVQYEPIRASHGGFLLFEEACELGRQVKQGTVLATIVDVMGTVLETVKVPYDCLIIAVPGQPSIPEGGAQIGTVARVVEVLKK